jgi:signal peptidase I
MNDIIKKAVFCTIQRNLKSNKMFLLKISGTSMLPFLKEGESVMVDPSTTNIKFGDLVLIKWGDMFVVHRLLNKKTFLTKGDNLLFCDPMQKEIICSVINEKKYNKIIAIVSYMQTYLNSNFGLKMKFKSLYSLINMLRG